MNVTIFFFFCDGMNVTIQFILKKKKLSYFIFIFFGSKLERAYERLI